MFRVVDCRELDGGPKRTASAIPPKKDNSRHPVFATLPNNRRSDSESPTVTAASLPSIDLLGVLDVRLLRRERCSALDGKAMAISG